jgi:hypothetical protein
MSLVLQAKLVELALVHGRKVAVQLLRILRVLWHQVVGFLFLVLSAWGLLWLLRTWRTFEGESEILFKMALVGLFVFMMGSFGISSFWRARRISRGK